MDHTILKKNWHIISALITIVLIINSIGSPANAQSQPQFEGIIAFVDHTGNIILASGDGKRVPLTTDADLNQDPLAEELKPSYSIFGFSPNGKYLAIERNMLGERSVFLIYDVATLSVAAELNFSGVFAEEWHKDSDSIITHQIVDEDFGGYTSPHHYYYRQYLSGEQVVLFESYKTNNAFQINYDINTYFELDTRRSEPRWGVFENWAEQTKKEIRLSYDHVIGEWSKDGTRFIHIDNEFGKIDIIDVDAGNIMRSLEMPGGLQALERVHHGPLSHTSRSVHSSRFSQFLLSPNSSYLLLTDNAAGLHQINLETSVTEPIFTWPVNNSENSINALWSNSGNFIMLNTQSPDIQKILILRNGNLPIHVAANAEPLFWLSKDSERLVYAQYNISGSRVDGELIVYDQPTGISTKIGDLPTVEDISASSQGKFQQYWKSVDWTNGEVFLPTVPSQTNTIPPTSPICQDAAPVQPIMLVVGWGGSENSPGLERETNEFAVYTREFFANYGYVPGCNIFYVTGTSPNKNQKENANEIQRSLCEAYNIIKGYRPDWNGHFDIIGHSYGGLRSRAYLENDQVYGFCTVNGASEKVIKVDNLFTLGSPHGGEPFADELGMSEMLPLASIIFFPEFVSTIPIPSLAAQELLPPVRTWVNHSSRQPSGTNYHLIIGNVEKDLVTKASQIININLFPGGRIISDLLTISHYSNDLAVHQNSSLILNSIFLRSRYPNVLTSVTHDWHGWDPLGRAKFKDFSPPTYYSDSETLIRHVLPYVGKTDVPSGGGGGGSWMVLPDNMRNKIIANTTPISISQQEIKMSAPQLHIHIGDGVLAPGQSQKFEFYVSQSEDVNLILLTNNKDLSLQLVHPDGINMTEDSPEIQYQELTLEGRTIKGYQLNNIPVGTWIINLNGAMITEDAFFVVSAIPSTPISLQPILPEWLPNQKAVEISVKFSWQDLPVLESDLIANIIRPDGSQQTLDLFDDGFHQDGNANDGVYGNIFTQTDIGGVYRVFFTAKGAQNNLAFIRNAFSFFVVAPATAKLGDLFSDSGIDKNRDGAYEFLEIQIPLVVSQSGDFVVSGDLYAGDTFITSDEARLSFQTGTQIMSLRFDGRMIYDSQKDGPYTVRNILLLDETAVPLLIEERQSFTTAQYAYTDFGTKTSIIPNVILPPNIFIAGGISILCLTILIVSSVFVINHTRKSKASRSKGVNRPQTAKPVPTSIDKIQKAINASKDNRHQEAFEILREVVQAEPNNMRAWFNLGGVLASMGNYKDAERCYLRAKQLGHPRGDDALKWLREKRR